jgi:ribosomal protein L37AE/L43A
MLHGLTEQIAHCHLRAAECIRLAACAASEADRQIYVQRERAWLTLAHRYEHSERLGQMLNDRQRRRLREWPATQINAPNCPSCNIQTVVHFSAVFVCSNCQRVVEQTIPLVGS